MDASYEGVSADITKNFTIHRILFGLILASAVIFTLFALDAAYRAAMYLGVLIAVVVFVALLSKVRARLPLLVDCQLSGDEVCFVYKSVHEPADLRERDCAFFLIVAGIFSLHAIWQIVWFVAYAGLGVYEKLPYTVLVFVIDIVLMMLFFFISLFSLDD